MSAQTDELFPDESDPDDAPERRYNTGILPSKEIHALIDSGALRADPPVLPEQVQPASLDLRLGPVAYRVRASFLPGKNHTVQSKVADLGTHEIDLTKDAVLERGGVYIVPLLESVKLRKGPVGRGQPEKLDRSARHLHPIDHGLRHRV